MKNIKSITVTIITKMPKNNQMWQPKEEEFFEKAWNSGKYDKETLIQIFSRTWSSLSNKAERLGLESWGTIEARARIVAIQKMLEEDHII